MAETAEAFAAVPSWYYTTFLLFVPSMQQATNVDVVRITGIERPIHHQPGEVFMVSTGLLIAILAVGVIVVVGGVLLLKLHAFLALTLGALAVGLLTPQIAMERYSLASARIAVREVDEAAGELQLDVADLSAPPAAGAELFVVRPNPQRDRLTIAGRLVIRERRSDGSVRASFVDSEKPRLQADDWIVSPRAWAETQQSARRTVGERVATAFGATCGKIGIVIAMAAIIGKCLLDSGAADRIVRAVLQWLGQARASLAFLTSGFVLGIPVFFDTVFYLMIPLGKAMRMRTGRHYLLYVLSIVAGATMAHSLVPPTPGPLFVAEELGVDLGTMILAGCAVGLFTAGFGWMYAVVASRIWDLPLRDSPDFSLEELRRQTDRDLSGLPPLWLSLLPILLPVVLIGGATILRRFPEAVSPWLLEGMTSLGNKNIALLLSAAIAVATLAWQKRSGLRELAVAVQAALASGGVIILITAAGGAFGATLQQTGVSLLIQELPQVGPLAILGLAFLITAAIRTAQGSATVAMMTAVGILAGVAQSETLGFHPVWLALAIGCGSKPVAWMNDSGFWVITKMSGMTEAEGLKYVTPMTTCMGLVGLIVVLLGATLFPLT